MSNSNIPTPPAKPTGPAGTAPAAHVSTGGTPLQPPEPGDESVLESIGNAISAPVRDAAEDEERKQVGQPRGKA